MTFLELRLSCSLYLFIASEISWFCFLLTGIQNVIRFANYLQIFINEPTLTEINEKISNFTSIASANILGRRQKIPRFLKCVSE